MLALAGCAGDAAPRLPPDATGAPSPGVAETPATRPVLAAAAVSGRSDAELWSQSCSRCHNARDPAYYTPGQWTLVMQHMRTRGYLTGDETRRIAAFLRDASK
jgi:cytochrome c5